MAKIIEIILHLTGQASYKKTFLVLLIVLGVILFLRNFDASAASTL